MTTRNPDLVISRRLDSDSSGPRPVDRPPKCGSEHIDLVGVSSKYGKVRIDSVSGGYFHQSQVSAPEGLGYSSSGQSSEVERDSIHHAFSTPIVSLPISTPIGSDGVLSVGHSWVKVTNETYPNVSTGSLQTQQEGNLGTYPIERAPLIPHLQWWLKDVNLFWGVPLKESLPEITLTADATSVGWGGVYGQQSVQGWWTAEQQKLHINILELEAVILCVQQFHMMLRGKMILLRSDNSAVVTYINKQGSTKYPSLCMKTWQLFQRLREMSCLITATHLAGVTNIQADFLSRHRVLPTEWSLHHEVVLQIFQYLGRPLIDLFASDLNHCLPTFCSWNPSVKALAIDAFTLDWSGMMAYAYPPICLIPRVPLQVECQSCTMILIAPFWPKRAWFTKLLNLLVDVPLVLPVRKDLLKQPRGMFFHPNPGLFQLGLALLTLSWDKNWDSHSLVNGYPSFYPRIALVAPSPGGLEDIQQPIIAANLSEGVEQLV